MTRFAYSMFCDDIRNEVNSKISMMGIIGSLMYVQDFPVTLPKLCVVVTASTPNGQPFRALTFRGTMDGNVLFDLSMDEPQLEQLRQTTVLIDDPKGFEAKAIVVLSPLHLPAPTKIQVTVVADGEEVECGGMQISKAPDDLIIV